MAIDLTGGMGGVLAGLGVFPEGVRRAIKPPDFPLLAPVQPPKRRRRTARDPFDFFGTLFVPPTTAGLTAFNALNRTD